jgi:hypothetical protein
MSVPTQKGSSARTALIAFCVLVLIALLIATCRRSRTTPSEIASPGFPSPTPVAVTPLPKLRDGLEIVTRDPAVGLITVRDRATSATVRITAADFSPEAVDRAFAQRLTTREGITPTPTPTATAAAKASQSVTAGPGATPTGPPPPPGGSGTAGTPGSSPAPSPVDYRPVAGGLPAFVPRYPGAETLNLTATREQGPLHGNLEFTTADAPEVVGKFYADKMAGFGLSVVVNVAGSNAAGATFTLMAEDASSGRSLSLTVGMDKAQSHASIEFSSR